MHARMYFSLRMATSRLGREVAIEQRIIRGVGRDSSMMPVCVVQHYRGFTL